MSRPGRGRQPNPGGYRNVQSPDWHRRADPRRAGDRLQQLEQRDGHGWIERVGHAGTTGAAGTSGAAGTTGARGPTRRRRHRSGAAPRAGGSAAPGDGGVADAFTGTPDAGAPYAAACAATVRNKGACMTATDVQCANTCGPNKSGYKNCDCYSDVWDCPRCEYVPGDYACYRLPDPARGLPMVETGRGHHPCPRSAPPARGRPCSPCGSATLISYLDSAGAPKAGYCVCGSDQKWTCASTTEWPH